MAAANKRQPPPGYPTGGDAKEEQAPPVDINKKAQQANGGDEDETDRGFSGGFIINRPRPRSRDRYPGPGLIPFDDYEPVPPRGRYSPAPVYDYPPPPRGPARHGFPAHVSYEASDDEDEVDYEGGYGHQAIRRPQQPQQYYQRQTAYVVEEPPPPPPRRRPAYPPPGNYYVSNEYGRY